MIRLLFATGLAGLVLLALTSVTSADSSSAAQTIAVDEFWYCAPQFQSGVCDKQASLNHAVYWNFSTTSELHTVTECGASCDSPTLTPLFDSGLVPGGGSPFKFTFTTPGVYLYYCKLHPATMRGRIFAGVGIVGGVAELNPATGAVNATAPESPHTSTTAALAVMASTLVVVGGSGAGAWWWLRRRAHRA